MLEFINKKQIYIYKLEWVFNKKNLINGNKQYLSIKIISNIYWFQKSMISHPKDFAVLQEHLMYLNRIF
jgi:hypothetical protein